MLDFNGAPRLSDYDTSDDYLNDYKQLSASHERDIHREIAGREAEVLAALGISIGRRSHQRCPLGTHEDKNPSWRWDARQRRWHCSCGHGTVIDAAMLVQGLDAGGAIRWIREALHGDAPPVRRAAYKPPPPEPPAEQRHEAAAGEAARRWNAARPADPRHPYLIAKGIQPHGLRQEGNQLLVPLYDIAGKLWNLQLIWQRHDGKFKKLYLQGSRASGVFSPLGLGGDPERLIVAEGIATAATLFEATGWPTLAAMSAGNLKPVAEAARQAWPEAEIVIAGDDDRHTAGNPGRVKATAAALAVGARLAVPQFPEGAKGTDFNDLAQLEPGAARAAIEAAEMPEPPAPATAPAIATMDAAEAAERSRQAIARFVERALAWQPQPEPSADLDFNSALPAPVVGIRGSLGLGKTQHILEQLVRPEMADKHISFYAPEHRLNGELLERFNAMAGPGSPRAMAIFGREQTKPDGTVMCQKADLVRKIAPLKVNIQSHLCERRRETGEIDPETGKKKIEIERCEVFESCPYQAQRADRAPAVRFLSHAHLFIKGAVPRADFAVIDESFWQGALRGTDVRFHKTPDGIAATGGYFVSLGNLQLPRRDVSDGKNADLVDLSQRCAKALYAGGSLKDFQDAGVTAEAVTEATMQEYKRLEKLAVSPAMPRARQEAAIGRYREQEARRFGQFFALLAASLNEGVDPCADRLELVPDALTKEGIEDRVYLYWRAAIRAPKAPTLLLDADFAPEVARRFFPGLEDPTIAEARLQAYRAVQITDHSVPKSRLAPPAKLPDDETCPERIARHQAEARRRANRRGEVRRLIEVEAARGQTACITYKSAREAIEAEGPIPNASFGHWNRLRGHDEWRDVDTLVVVGVPQPNAETIERMGRAMCHGDPNPIETIPPDQHGRKRYKRETRLIAMADGTTVPVEVDIHPDPRCTLLLDLIRAETAQAVGRARLVHRDPARPCRVLVITNYPLPMAMHETTTWNEFMPNPLQVLMARGLVPSAWRDVAAVLADMIEADGTRAGDTVATAFKRAGLPSPAELVAARVSNIPLWEASHRGMLETQPFRYRVRGRRQGGEILVNLARHPDPKSALEATFGELDVFEPLEEPPADGDEVMAQPAAAVQPEPVVEAIAAPEPEPQPAAEPAAICSECGQPIDEQVTSWWGGLPAHDACGVAVWQRDQCLEPEPPSAGPSGAPPPAEPEADAWCGWPGPDPAIMRQQIAAGLPPLEDVPLPPARMPEPRPRWQRPPLPPRQRPLSPLAPVWYRRLVEEGLNGMEVR